MALLIPSLMNLNEIIAFALPSLMNLNEIITFALVIFEDDQTQLEDTVTGTSGY